MGIMSGYFGMLGTRRLMESWVNGSEVQNSEDRIGIRNGGGGGWLPCSLVWRNVCVIWSGGDQAPLNDIERIISPNVTHKFDVALMLGQRRRRWSNINLTSYSCLVFSGIYVQSSDMFTNNSISGLLFWRCFYFPYLTQTPELRK